MVSEVRPSMRIGASAGFTLRQLGFRGRLFGSCPRAALMDACTSRAAASMLRFRSNCSVMLVEPSVLDEVISFTPAMRPNCRSSGVATAEAMVSGLAPGRPAFTEIEGKSTCGSGAIGRKLYATAPEIPRATVSRVVATGRSINAVEITTAELSSGYRTQIIPNNCKARVDNEEYRLVGIDVRGTVVGTGRFWRARRRERCRSLSVVAPLDFFTTRS